MKKCVLFPKAFANNYMNGSAAHTLNDIPSSYEQYLSPGKNTTTPKSKNSQLSLVKKSNEVNNEKRPTLLYVEDNPQLRLLASIFLKSHFNVVSTPTGEEAIEMAKKYNHDFILVDINLGEGIDGFETSRRLRNLEKHKKTPIVALTTNEYKEVRNDCITSQINGYIQKPFDRTYLIGTIQELDKQIKKGQHNIKPNMNHG